MEMCNPVVLDVLSKASSQDANLLKPAEQQLKAWETEPGFYSTLLTIFSNHSIDINVRWLAVLYFKNGVDRYWRKLAPKNFGAHLRRCHQNKGCCNIQDAGNTMENMNYAISEDEKKVLRQKLLLNFGEPVNQLAVQLAVLISKIARFDCPKEWPELVPTLLEVIRTNEDLCQQRALLTLHHVIKALSSKCLAGDRRIFKELSSTIFSYMLQLWSMFKQTFVQQTQQKQNSIGIHLEKALISLKVLRKLVVYGFTQPSQVEDAVQFLTLVFQEIKPLIECRKSLYSDDHLRGMCEKYLILLTKVLHDVLELHPFSFIQFIRPTLECTISLCFSSEWKGCLFERFIVQCMNLIKSILLCSEYKTAKVPEETKEPRTLQAHMLKMEFFTYPTLVEICQSLLSHYFLLTEDDLQMWNNDPEGFAVDEGGETWKFSLRPCTEVFFLSLFHEFRQNITPLVLEMIQNVQSAEHSTDIRTILQKEAVYNAVGLAAFHLYDEVDFDNWFLQVLIPELKIMDNDYKIMRRRIILMIGQWIDVKLSPELRPTLYQTVLSLLDPKEDLVVRLAAASTLKVAVDDFEFSIEQFLPYLETSVGLLCHLLKEVNECDTQMNVLYVMSFIIERVGSQIRPHVASLIHYLPVLWDTSGDHNMLRCAIISNLVHLVQGLGTLNEELHSFLLPVIAYSTDITQPPHVYLAEDALELWWAVLDNTSVCSPELLRLANNIFPLIESGSDNLKMCLQLIQAYVLLSPNDFLQNYGNTVVTCCCKLIQDIRPQGMIMIMRLVEIAFRVFPEEGPQLFQPILNHVLSYVLGGEDYALVLSVYLSVLSRVILHNQQCFSALLREKAAEMTGQTDDVLAKLLDVWMSKMSIIHPIERRKLLGLALASLLTSNSRIVHDRICGVLLAVVEVLNDIMKSDDVGAQIDALLLTENDTLQQRDDDDETEHDRRKLELSRKDLVHTVALKNYLRSQMTKLQQSVGLSNFEQLMATVDKETMDQLKLYLH